MVPSDARRRHWLNTMTKNTASKPAKAAAPKPTAVAYGIDLASADESMVAVRIDMNDAGFRFERVEAEDLKAQ